MHIVEAKIANQLKLLPLPQETSKIPKKDKIGRDVIKIAVNKY